MPHPGQKPLRPDRAGQVAVIFECSQMSKELSSIRIEQVQIQLKEYEGLFPRRRPAAILTTRFFCKTFWKPAVPSLCQMVDKACICYPL